MNNVNLVGRITRDPELRQAGDTAITTVFVATDRPKLNREGRAGTEQRTVKGTVAAGPVTCWSRQGGLQRPRQDRAARSM